MILTLTPIRPAGTLAERRLTLDRQGDALTVCGLRFDLAPLPEGAELPAQALAGPDFAGPVTRRGGVLRLGLHRWLGPEAPPEARLPATIALHDGQNGPVPLPGDEATHPADAPGATPGAIDWAQMITPEARAAESRSTAARALRQRRDRALAAGLNHAGHAFRTDDLSQQRLTAAALAASRDPDLTIRWKTASGAFVTLDASAVLAIANALRAHVQACFDREAELLAALDAGTPYDPDSGWPGN